MKKLALGMMVSFLLLVSASWVEAQPIVAWGDNTYGQTSVPAGLNGVIAIAAGDAHSVALKSDGTVVAWGANDWGQTDVPAGLSGVIAVAAGGAHTVALKSDGTVVAWGAGMTNTGCFMDCGQSMVPAGLSGVTAISAGRVHTVALTSDGTVVAWGANGYDLGQTSVPAGLSGVTAISAGIYHNLALKNDGTVVAWGWNGFSQTDVPAGLNGVIALAAGFGFSMALKSDGTAEGWGGGPEANIPVGLSDVTAIAANCYDAQALKSDGTVVTWGGNHQGAGITPAGLSGVTAIAAGCGFTVALLAPPILIDAHANLTAEATSASGAIVTYTPPATYDAVDGAGVATCAPASGATFALGTTTVTCTATNQAGNPATPTSFTVTVADTTPPALALPANLVTDPTSASGAAVSFAALATDAVDGVRPVSCTPSSGSTFVIGATTVSCTTDDTRGNASVGTFTVTVRSASQVVTDLVALTAIYNFQQGAGLLQNVLNGIAAGNTSSACAQLSAFINQVQAQSGKKLTAAQAAALISAATTAKAAISCL